MKVALVHDDLVQWGGAERVLMAISEIFPEAPIYTSVFDYSNPVLKKEFKDKKIITSFMQKIPGWKGMYKTLLPLYPIAFEQFDFSQYDLVISHTTRFAKSIITKPETKHICYCHTPPRFLWNFSGERINGVLSPYLSFLRIYDQITARRVDYFLAGSMNAQKRIKKIYQVDSEVLYPFVDLENFEDLENFDGNYFLIICRLNPYKRVDLAVEVFNQSGDTLKIIGDGPMLRVLQRGANPNIQFLGSVSEEIKLNLLAGCQALIVTGEEDFGITPLEAQAAGKPVIAYGVGGALETIIKDKTGIFFDEQTVKSLQKALEKLEKIKISSRDCVNNAKKFSKERFQKSFLETINALL